MTYKTKNGSTVTISGKHNGIVEISFDWFEEDNACVDCTVNVDSPNDYHTYRELMWVCNYCGGGRADLIEVNEDDTD